MGTKKQQCNTVADWAKWSRNVCAKLSPDQDMQCTGWPVCTLRILWHSDGSCRGIPPRHLNSDIQQPAVSSQPTMEPFYTRGHFLCAGDLDTDSGGQILNAGQVAGRLGRKNTRTTSLYCIDSSILQYKMWFVCITALLINNPDFSGIIVKLLLFVVTPPLGGWQQ